MMKILSIGIMVSIILISCKDIKSTSKEDKSFLIDNTSYFDSIYQFERLIRADDNKMVSVIDSLFSKDSLKQSYYFIVFTKSMNDSDGFYSEALGLASLEYLRKNPKQFLKHFADDSKLNERDLMNWADSVSGELLISREGEEYLALSELKEELLSNENGLNDTEVESLKEFLEKIKNTLPQQRV